MGGLYDRFSYEYKLFYKDTLNNMVLPINHYITNLELKK
jgi:hypothetical protein